MAEARPKTITEYPKLSLTEIAQVLGKKWKEADEQTKSKFAAAFLKEKEAYDKLKARYESSLTQEQKDEIVDYRKTIAEKKEKLAHKKVEIDFTFHSTKDQPCKLFRKTVTTTSQRGQFRRS